MGSETVRIRSLGSAEFDSPLGKREDTLFVTPDDDISIRRRRGEMGEGTPPEFFEAAGPRRKIYFSPENLRCGILTCGGLCPGLNDIIREIVFKLYHGYGVSEIDGFRFGYRGLALADEIPPLELTPDLVDSIHRDGGTILSSSRGPQDIDRMIDTLIERRVGVLFAVGGDGTIRGAHSIAERVRERNLDISVTAVPKTIDNDIAFVSRSFGFETAVQAASDIIDSAHTEARGYFNGIGLVKLMGRHSGYIASAASLANRNVNYCLIPELPFRLEGKGGLLEVLEERLALKEHAVIAVAEGAGQDLLNKDRSSAEKDASGNLRLGDIGKHLKSEIERYLGSRSVPVNIKYFEPSYIIRSVPANASDSIYCVKLAQNTVHAALSGRTDMLVSLWNSDYVHIPLSMAVSETKCVDIRSRLWRTVMEATRQPYSLFKDPGGGS